MTRPTPLVITAPTVQACMINVGKTYNKVLSSAPQSEVDTENYYIFDSCLRTVDVRSGRIAFLKAIKSVNYSKSAIPPATTKAIRPGNPACVHVAASGVRTARSWWNSTNRSQCEHQTQLQVEWVGRAGCIT